MLIVVAEFAWMMLEDFVAKASGVGMEVDFRCADLLVTQHGLDGTEVGSAFEECGGEAVSEGVRADVLMDAGLFDEEFDEMEDRDARHFLAKAAEEDIVLVTRTDVYVAAVVEVELKFVDGPLGNGDEALLGAFAVDADEFFVEVEVLHLEFAELADAKSAAEKGLDDGPVAMSIGVGEVYGCFYAVNFLYGKRIWQMLGFLGKFEQLHRIGFQFSAEHEETVVAMNACEDAGERGGCDANINERGGKLVEMLEADFLGVSSVPLPFCVLWVDEVDEFLSITLIGFYRIVGEALLKFQILMETR